MRPIWPQLTHVCGKAAIALSASPSMPTMWTVSPRAVALSAIVSGSRPPPARIPIRVMVRLPLGGRHCPLRRIEGHAFDEGGGKSTTRGFPQTTPLSPVRIFSRVGVGDAQRALAAGANEGDDLPDDRMVELLLHVVEALQEGALVGKQQPVGTPERVDVLAREPAPLQADDV